MDWSKVDAALAAVLAAADDPTERRLAVFVHFNAVEADPSVLAALDLRGSSSDTVCTGLLSVLGVEKLTDQPWVTRVNLSGPLRLLSRDERT